MKRRQRKQQAVSAPWNMALGALAVIGCTVLWAVDGCGAVSPEIEQVGKLSGIVRDPSGVPAPGVRVVFYPGRYNRAPEYAEGQTDKDGRYGLNLQRQKLATDDRPWTGGVVGDCLLARDLERNLCAIHRFSPRAGDTDMTLQPAVSMSGTVKGSAGAPITNAVLHLTFATDVMKPELARPPVRVDPLGAFSIPALPREREYDFTVSAQGYGACRRRLQEEMVQTSGYEFPTLVLRKADRSLAGRVVDLDGKLVENASVWLSGPGQPEEFAPFHTDAKGRFDFKGVCEGPVVVTVEMFGPANDRLASKRFVGLEAGDTNILLSVSRTARDHTLGTTGEGAIPSLSRWVTNADEEVRIGAVVALIGLHPEPGLVLPILINALHDPSAEVQLVAVEELQQLGPDAKLAGPALVEFLSTPHYSLELKGATNALRKIDPEAAAKAGVKMPSP